MKIEILKQNGYNFLWIDNDLWMWDIPREVADQKEIADQAHGNVLVVGYGLGVIQKLLTENENVKSVTTIELYSKVLDACKTTYGGLCGEIMVGDFYNMIPIELYDCVIGDIWLEYADKELDEYIKFEKQAKLHLKEDGKILAWGQDYFKYLLEKKEGERI